MASISTQQGARKTSYKVGIRKPKSPTVTKTFSSKSLAQKWARRTELEIEEGNYFDKDEAEKHTVAELIDKYLDEELQELAETDWHASRLQVKWWKSEIGHLTLNKVKSVTLSDCRKKLSDGITPRNQKRSGSKVNRYIAALNAAFGVAVKEWHWVNENPVLRIKKEKENHSRVRFLSSDERIALLKACKESKTESLYLITLLALSTGIRQAEIMTLAMVQRYAHLSEQHTMSVVERMNDAVFGEQG